MQCSSSSKTETGREGHLRSSQAASMYEEQEFMALASGFKIILKLILYVLMHQQKDVVIHKYQSTYL